MTLMLPIVTERLRLRLFEDRDLDAFAAYRGDPEVARYQGWSSFSREDARQFLEDQRYATFGVPCTWFQIGIADLESDRLLGDCALHFLDEAQVEIGFTLARENQGRGIMHEALSGLLDAVFWKLGKHRVIAITDGRNTQAGRLLSGLGFRREGHFVQASFFKGEWCDELHYACLASEWKERRR